MERPRKHITKPPRYREQSTTQQPKKESHKPFYVYQPSPYNPNLRPACFPTLALDQEYCDHISSLSLRDSLPSIPERPALVFRDLRVRRDMDADMDKDKAEPEKVGEVLPASGEKLSLEGLGPVEDLEPGEYDGADVSWVDEDGKDLPRFPLPVSIILLIS